jgi:transcriptional regulator with XRE-family HTH domain
MVFMLKITLRMAREMNGYTMEDAAERFCMITDNYSIIEDDPGQIMLGLICKIAAFYGVPMNIIYPGTESECIEHNRKLTLSRGNI